MGGAYLKSLEEDDEASKLKVSRPGNFTASTGSPEAVARLRFPQNVACGFPALRSSAGDSQHCKSLQLRVREAQLWFQ